uniref:Uncharacterized protein MANES_13G031700 n=1 Tax=Rhizophora mucronata TaxID=61149 RepID=A0A2P2MWB6_RHIMU
MKPTFPVPNRCMLNNSKRRMIETMTRAFVPNPGISPCRPLTADITDIAGVKIPSPIIMEVPIRTNNKRNVFKDDLLSRFSFMFKALSNSGVGNLSLKLEICSSAG